MKIRLLYFAVLRDIVGKSEEVVDLPDGTRALEVWQRLRADHRALAAYDRPPMTAVNEEYADASDALHDGDEVAFIPPVAGG
ncbi:MAG TPA: molybdopterin converting factor subunit 1 [Thermoanaerobaculia bacterium]|nr:molybdopterin converting factor subunit 1 [Thermoanaerobaculia bacterium]